jgi:hypothetical protein
MNEFEEQKKSFSRNFQDIQQKLFVGCVAGVKIII